MKYKINNLGRSRNNYADEEETDGYHEKQQVESRLNEICICY